MTSFKKELDRIQQIVEDDNNEGLDEIFNVEEALENSISVNNLKQDFFVLELLEKCTHKPKAFGTKFEKWIIVDRKDVYVGKNDKSTQTRAGTQLFLTSVNQITKSVDIEGWDYSLPQPTIALYEKVAPNGKYYKYQLIDGRHRSEKLLSQGYTETKCYVLQFDDIKKHLTIFKGYTEDGEYIMKKIKFNNKGKPSRLENLSD